MKINIFFLTIFLFNIGYSQTIVLSLRNTCSCSQLISEDECQQFSPICTWQVNQASPSNCAQTLCFSLDSQADCLELPSCQWSGNQCIQFYSNCNSLEATSKLSCQQQNKLCFGTLGQCQSLIQLPSCETYTTTKDCQFGNEGKCTWITSQCLFITNCGQVPLNQCNTYKPYETKSDKGQYCHINSNKQCVQMQCSDITNQAQCTYVQTVFNQDQFQLCFWLQESSQCMGAGTASYLTESTCLLNSLGNYHWIPQNQYTKEGICFRCQYLIQNRVNSCACEQLVAQLDCISAQICDWIDNKCKSTACLNIVSQEACASSPNCMYDQKARGCRKFTKCSDLKGQNQFQCLAQSFQCPGSNGNNCVENYDQNYANCSSITSYQICNNTLLNKGVCIWNSSYDQCQLKTSCYQLSENECLRYKKSCYYNGYGCQSAYCSVYKNIFDCTYIFNLYDGQINTCQWSVKYRSCQYVYPEELTYGQCYANSNGQNRWSSLDDKLGVCTQCTPAIVPKSRKQCECDQLIYQGDCASANESCLWKPETSQCVQIKCEMLRTRSECIANYDCHWIQYQDVYQCLPFTSCDKLPGTNSYMCMLYSYRCTQTDGKYCQEIQYTNKKQKCSQIADYTNCYLTVAVDGVCRWNQETNQCYSLSQCSDINIPELCGINNYACYWDYSTNLCQSFQCSMATSDSTCTYYDQQINYDFQIQICQWNSTNATCLNATNSDLTSTNCFTNSAGTYKWSQNDATDGKCESCTFNSILSIIIVSLLFFLY